MDLVSISVTVKLRDISRSDRLEDLSTVCSIQYMFREAYNLGYQFHLFGLAKS